MRFEILLDRGETANKCTIAPLAYRTDFCLRRFNGDAPIAPLASDILLHMDGAPLEELGLRMAQNAGVNSIAAIDCVWRRLDPILRRIELPLPRLGRIPDGFQTAYPRRSHAPATDPDGGLATIEALFIGAAFCGHWDTTMLCEYYFADTFLALNRERFLHFGIVPPPKTTQVYVPTRTRDAKTRRLSRGRPALPADSIDKAGM